MFKTVVASVALVLAGVLAGLAMHTALAKGDSVFAGKQPSNLGVTDGRLAAPRRTPNCVSSQVDPGDARHYIAPIKFSGAPGDAIASLRRIVEASPRTRVVSHETLYLYAQYKSNLMGFVDDVEFVASAAENMIHVRSASRLGRRDFGVNRDRIEAIRARFAAAQGKPVKT